MKTLWTKKEIRERVTFLLNDIAGIPLERITDGATIEDDLKMESVAFVELQVAFEEEFDILIDPLQVIELNEFSALVSYLYECTIDQGVEKAQKRIAT